MSPIFFVESDEDADGVYEEAHKIKLLIERFASEMGINVHDGMADICDVVRAYSRDVRKLIAVDSFSPNEYKQAGYLAFWIRKLKPLFYHTLLDDQEGISKAEDTTLRVYLNEVFALYVAIAIVFSVQNENKKGTKTQNLKELLR